MAYRKKLPRTFEKFKAGLEKLEESLSGEFEAKYDKEILIEIVIKRFEYTFESMWKTLKEIVLEEGIDCSSPLGCFKEAFKLGLIEDRFEDVFPLMVKKRNEAVHLYSYEDSLETYLLIKSSFTPAIVDMFKKIRDKF